MSKKIKHTRKNLDETVQPIKKRTDRVAFKNYWLSKTYHGNEGLRNWTIFRTGIVSALRASDLCRLQMYQLFTKQGHNLIPRPEIINEKDKKTGKHNNYLDIKQLHNDLINYLKWRKSYGIKSKWLFPRHTDKTKHISPDYIYRMLKNASTHLGIPHIGSHSLRKTFGYLAYTQTNNLIYVMKRLNQRTPDTTLRYIGISKAKMNQITDSINLS